MNVLIEIKKLIRTTVTTTTRRRGKKTDRIIESQKSLSVFWRVNKTYNSYKDHIQMTDIFVIKRKGSKDSCQRMPIRCDGLMD